MLAERVVLCAAGFSPQPLGAEWAFPPLRRLQPSLGSKPPWALQRVKSLNKLAKYLCRELVVGSILTRV